MNNEFKAEDSQRAQHTIIVEEAPEKCPLCHVAIDPKFLSAFFRDNEYPTVRDNNVQAVLQCPRRDCWSIFIAVYFQRNDGPRRGAGPPNKYQLVGVAPYTCEEKTFPESITKLSPSFCRIFNEAAEAESRKLENIAGPGYRKALEFLVKDFLISEYSAQAEDIKKTWLGNLITDKITDGNIKACAQRAAWLGNDETHYLRKWEDKDIGDLKTLISLCVNWIDSHLLTKEYQKTM